MNQTADEILNELMMSTSFRAHFVVEGETDRQLFDSMLKEEGVINVVPLGGGGEVVDLIIAYRKSGQTFPLLGVIDRDYRIPLGNLPSHDNLVITDLRDVECMMIDSEVFKAVLEAFGSKEKIKNIGGVRSVKSKVISIAREIALIRFYSQKKGMHLKLSDIEIAKFVSLKDLSLDVHKMLSHMGNKQDPRVSLTVGHYAEAKEEVARAICDGSQYFSNDLMLCRGHDLIDIVSLGLRKVFGSCKDVDVRRDQLERAFRIGYVTHIRLSSMFNTISAWISRNAGIDPNGVWV